MPERFNLHLLDLARRLQTVTSYGELVMVATSAMRDHTRYRSAWLTLLDVEKQLAYLLAGTGLTSMEAAREVQMQEFSIAGDRMIAEILRSREPIVIEDARRDPRPNPEAVEAFGSRTIVNIPLLFDDCTLGAFGFGTFKDTGPMPPTEYELTFLNGMASHMSVVISRIRAEERRREAEAQLQRVQRLEAMGSLAGGVAHDFNNMLMVIYGNLSMADSVLDADHPAQPFLREIDDAAARCSALSQQLLAFARRQPVQPRPVNLNTVVEGVMKMLSRVIPGSVSTTFLPGRSLGTVLADPSQIEQVVMNLAINARDAMPDGGRLLLETENVLIDEAYRGTHPWARTGRFVLLTVTDSGIGMDAEVQRRVFEPFFTTKGPERGTGLGLSVVFGIAEQHGGMVRVYSEPGHGTSFKVYLPIVERVATAVGTKIERLVRGGDEHILVADDDERVRSVVRNMLAQEGYRVTEVGDGAEALACCAAAEPPVDLVLSDVVMPRMDGAQLYQVLQERHPGLPVLIMSGYATNSLVGRFEVTEHLRILGKPFRGSELLRSVRELLDQPRLPLR